MGEDAEAMLRIALEELERLRSTLRRARPPALRERLSLQADAVWVVLHKARRLVAQRAMLAAVSAGDEVKRRDLLRLVPMLAVGPAALERLSVAHDTDVALLDAYSEVLTGASLAYHAADMRALHDALRPHLAGVEGRLRGSMGETLRRRLGTVAAETAVLAGWTALVVGRRGLAFEHYRFAEQAAGVAHDGGLTALAVESRASLFSSVVFGGWSPSQVALEGLRRARQHLDPSAPPILRQWVLSRLAHEMAAAGDEGFFPVLQEAHDVSGALERAPTGLYAPGGYWATGARLWDVEAIGLAMLGRPDPAEAILRAEIFTTPAELVRRHAILRVCLAHVHAQQGEPEQGALEALRALELARVRDSTLDVQRVASAHQRLARWDLPAVRELGERLAA